MELSWSHPWVEAAAGLGVATACGLLVGLERERAAGAVAEEGGPQGHFAGVRTLALVGMAGGLAGLTTPVLGPWLVLVVIIGITALAVVGGRQEDPAAHGVGLTTEVSMLLVALEGVVATSPLPGLALAERLALVGATAILSMALLALRRPLHRLAAAVSRDELISAAQLGLLLLVALPLLPNRDVGPVAGVNPFEIGMVVALIAAIGFGGYVAVRVVGPGRGMVLAGALGGLVSSTAVTLGLSGEARRRPELSRAAGAGIVLACAIMLPRQLLEIGVVARPLLPAAAVPLGTMAAVGAVAATLAILRREKAPATAPDRLRSPGTLGEALRFGLLYVVVLVVSDQAHRLLGAQGLHVSAMLAGIADVDAITLSVGRMHGDGLPSRVAVQALTLAAITNTGVKAGIAAVVGGRRVAFVVLAGLVPMMLAGGLVAFLVPG